jgi:hypothetical protein
MLLLLEGQLGEILEHFNKQCTDGNRTAFDNKKLLFLYRAAGTITK